MRRGLRNERTRAGYNEISHNIIKPHFLCSINSETQRIAVLVLKAKDETKFT